MGLFVMSRHQPHSVPLFSIESESGNASEAKSRGAIAVSGQINLGDEQEPQMLIDMGVLTTEAYAENMPVLGMVYPRGPNLVTLPNDITESPTQHVLHTSWAVMLSRYLGQRGREFPQSLRSNAIRLDFRWAQRR